MVFQFHHRTGAVLGMNLADHDLAGAGHLVDGDGRAQGVVRRRVKPIAQGAVAVGFAQFAAWVNSIGRRGACHGGPEKHRAGFRVEVLVLEALNQL
ncbi:hypothetical protein D3C76_1224860 [compost metagenome]